MAVLENYDAGSLPQMRHIGQNECPIARRWIHNGWPGLADTAPSGGQDDFRLF